MRATVRFAGALLVFALAACGGDETERRAPSLDDYTLPAPRPLGPVTATPVDRATFRVVARDVRYARGGTHATIDELRLRDVRLAGARRGATLLPARVALELPGDRRVVGRLAASAAAEADGALRFLATSELGASDVSIDATTLPSGYWTATVGLAPLVLADASGFAAGLPDRGRIAGTIALSGHDGSLRARSASLVLTTDSSRLAVSGAVTRSGERWSFDDVRLALDPVHPDDWREWLGAEPPIEAPIAGTLRADGGGRAGIDVSGSLRALTRGDSRLAADVDGRLWLEPAPRLDLDIGSRGLRLADYGPIDLDVRLGGGADSLAIVARARVTPDSADDALALLAGLPDEIAARLSTAVLGVDADLVTTAGARRVRGRAALVDGAGVSVAVVDGSAPLGGDGAIEVTAGVDSLALSFLPLPPQVEQFEGFARADVRVAGTVAKPRVRATVALEDVRFRLPEYGTALDSLRLGLRLEGDRLDLQDARAFVGGGRIDVTGGIRLARPLDLRAPADALGGARVDLAAHIDTMTVVDLDSLRAVVAGELRATGPLEQPHVSGRLAVLDGFAYEGKLAPSPPLDPADPPEENLLATAPWPDTPLRSAARAEAARERGSRPPPLTADVVATVAPDFRVIDEDSDLGVSGAVRLVVDERGAVASGNARIVDGFYAYYGELFRMTGGAFSVDAGAPKLAMSGVLRDAYRPLGVGQGGHDGLDRRDPPIGIFGYSTPATVLELLRRRTPLPATQPELAALLLFDIPIQPVDTWDHELMWRGDAPADLVGHRSAIQGAGLAWSYLADELYDYVPLDEGYLRAGTLRVGSRYPGWLMLGTQLEAGVHAGSRLTVRGSHVVGEDAWPGVALRFALRRRATDPADRHVELFNEPRFSASLGAGGRREDVDVRRRTGLRVRWRWDY